MLLRVIEEVEKRNELSVKPRNHVKPKLTRKLTARNLDSTGGFKGSLAPTLNTGKHGKVKKGCR